MLKQEIPCRRRLSTSCVLVEALTGHGRIDEAMDNQGQATINGKSEILSRRVACEVLVLYVRYAERAERLAVMIVSVYDNTDKVKLCV